MYSLDIEIFELKRGAATMSFRISDPLYTKLVNQDRIEQLRGRRIRRRPRSVRGN